MFAAQKNRSLSLVFATIMLAGCAVGPDYHPPEIPVPKAWISDAAQPVGQPTSPVSAEPVPAQRFEIPSPVPPQTVNTVEQEWWWQFNDPVLNDLITQALASNFDLQIAEARITQARASRSLAVSDLLPTVNIDGQASRQANQLAISGEPASFKAPYNTFKTGFDASWELDLFGGRRRAVEAASADEAATEANRDAVVVSLLAEVARTYIDIRQYQAQINIAKQIVTTEQNSVSISQQRFKAGQSPGIDVSQATAQAQQTEAQLPVYQSLLKQSEFSLDVLLGAQPGTSMPLVEKVQPLPVANDALILEAPAAVIANRPDIRAAEDRMRSATANQGVASAKFYPDISLTGFLGLLSTDIGTLATTGAKSWMGGATVLWPILNYGQLSANLDYADAKQKEALADYQKTVIAGLSDVERAITAYNKQKEHYATLLKVEQQNERVGKIAVERYRGGLTSFVDVLIAEQSLYNSRSQVEKAAAELLQNLIAVYKSLGRGWQPKMLKP